MLGGARESASAGASSGVADRGGAGTRGNGVSRATSRKDACGAATKSRVKQARHGTSRTTVEALKAGAAVVPGTPPV